MRLKSRELYKYILTRASWKAPVIVSEEAIEELRFWRSNVSSMNTEAKAIERSTFFEVCLFSDASSSGYGGYNKNVQSFLEIGSRKCDLQNIAVDVFEFCKRENMTISTQWIPREMNQEADYLSKCSNSEDWSIQDWVFEMLDKNGDHTLWTGVHRR